MRNVAIALDDETAHWAWVEAAHRDMSVSRLISEPLHEHMRARATYEDAMRRSLARAPVVLKEAGRYPTREELHHPAGSR
jgi:tetrahydromethanopterin S-methyltransferase subunit B